MGETILSVKNLVVHFSTPEGVVRAVDGVDFDIEKGKALGIVGESGSGKTVTALAVMRLISPPGRIVSGEILFDGQNLLTLSEKEMQRIRGRRISLIFQEPMSALNPVFTVGEQIAEMLRLHLKMSRRDAITRTVDLLGLVEIPSPEKRRKDYPHQLSGGMRQRVMIAMAISCSPDLVFADEPTTALDVTIQAQILTLLKGLREKLGMAMVFISHDLGVIAEVADSVAIMYAGRIVEHTSTAALFSSPRHPYTKGLLSSLPSFTPEGERQGRLTAIPGTVPRSTDLPSGCRFHPRCPVAVEICPREEPPLVDVAPSHKAACWLEIER